jgi:hypothetical protein
MKNVLTGRDGTTSFFHDFYAANFDLWYILASIKPSSSDRRGSTLPVEEPLQMAL